MQMASAKVMDFGWTCSFSSEMVIGGSGCAKDSRNVISPRESREQKETFRGPSDPYGCRSNLPGPVFSTFSSSPL